MSELTDDYIFSFITGSSLDEQGIKALQGIVKTKQPKIILELGSGVSTLAFSQIYNEFEHVYSIDDSDHYLAESKKRISADLSSKFTFIHAPLSDWNYKGNKFQTYDYNAIHSQVNQKIDLLFIDGPYARKYGRISTLPLVAHLLNEKCTIILDDAHRDTEEEALAIWRKIWGDQLQLIDEYPYRKGMKIFELKNPRKQSLLPFGLVRFLKNMIT